MALTLPKKTQDREARTAKDEVKWEKIELQGIDRAKWDRIELKLNGKRQS